MTRVLGEKERDRGAPFGANAPFSLHFLLSETVCLSGENLQALSQEHHVLCCIDSQWVEAPDCLCANELKSEEQAP